MTSTLAPPTAPREQDDAPRAEGSEAASEEALAASRRPVGILAAVLALALTALGGFALQSYSVALASDSLRGIAGQALPIKWEALTFQRAAFASGHLLPIYGSSELYCCGQPVRPTQLFAAEPTGFGTFPVGRAGTGDLFFVETFAALGRDLRGKKLVISDSPGWFFGAQGMGDDAYNGNFSPVIAEMVAFDAPISTELREAVARRMLDHQKSLHDQPFVGAALEALADPTPLHRAGYLAMYPAGRLDSWVHQLQDAAETVRFIRAHPELRVQGSNGPSRIEWAPQLAVASAMARERDTTNPFGFPDSTYLRIATDVKPAFDSFCLGRSNRGASYPTAWVKTMSGSAEWTDLDLELRVLDELGAQPLVFTMPIQGMYNDYASLSPSARTAYYRKYEQVVAAAGVPWLTFEEFDGDRYFLTDTGAHFSPRGWVVAGRALDLFWHDAPLDEIREGISALDRAVPPAAAPRPADFAYCKVVGRRTPDSR